MIREHALPEYTLFDAKSEDELMDFAERATSMGEQAQRIPVEYPRNTYNRRYPVDALVERFRTHQEA